ncbi:MAG: 30S ribosomal protein S16 [Planctomycetia bacterium]|nr:30S ribosomal protein S16 [Planctomycetia bacterium]
MSARIRMKRLGRKNHPYYRICAVDSRSPRDGRVIEELGTYDPLIRETDARVQFVEERLQYWLGVGALPSDRVRILIKKYGPNGTHATAQQAARERLAAPLSVPDAGTPAYVRPVKEKEAPAAPAAESATAVAEAEAPAEAAAPEAAGEATQS